MCESSSADVIFVASWLSESTEVLTNITWHGPSRGAGEREIPKAFWKNTFSLLFAWMFYTMETRMPCAPWESWSLDERQLPSNLPVITAVIKLSAFADDFDRQICQAKIWVEMWARSWILPEEASFRNMEIIWIVSFCSGKWIVLAVVTRFFTSVLMWMSGNFTWYVHPYST